MSVDRLRKAAALMRKRAERAMASGDGEPWFSATDLHDLVGAGSRNTADAEHMASWHPAAAIAVADLLARVADTSEAVGAEPSPDMTAVARAYLGT